MQGRCLPCIRIIFMNVSFKIFVILVFFNSVLSAQESIEKVILDKKAAFDGIETLHIKYATDTVIHDGGTSYREEFDLIWDRGKYLLKVNRTSKDAKTTENLIYAFDGEVYQFLHGNLSSLVVAHAPASSQVLGPGLSGVPLTRPWMGFYAGSDGLKGFSDSANVAKVLSQLSDPNLFKVQVSPKNDFATITREIKSSNGTTMGEWSTKFDFVYGTPVFSRTSDTVSKLISEAKFEEMEKYKLAKLDIFIPKKIVESNLKNGVKSVERITVLGEVNFNLKVDPEIFRLDAASIKNIYDGDNKNIRLR